MEAPEHDPLREISRRYGRIYAAVIVTGLVITVVCLVLYFWFC